MRNSVLPIPWTQRDSRPKSQAELDEEEQFDIYKEKELCAPRHCRTELDRLLDHYQEMITRMIEDPGYVYRINLETDYYVREAKKRADESARLAALHRERGEVKPKAEPREPKPPPAPKRDPAPPPPYFEHLNRIHEEEKMKMIAKRDFEELGGLEGLKQVIGPFFDEHGFLNPLLPDWICREYQGEIVEDYLRQKEGSLR